jgi:hypothetical protein
MPVMNKITLLLLFSVVLCVNATAQKKLYRGYYIKQNDDTVFCFMKRIASDVNPATIEVATDSSAAELKNIAVADIKEFGIFNGDQYKKYTALISTAFIDFVNMGYNPQINRVQKTVAFRVQPVTPDISFLTYKDKVKERYFILEKNNTAPNELDYHIYKLSEKNPEVIKKEHYKDQLKLLILKYSNADSIAIRERLKYLSYDDISILRFLNRFINGNEGAANNTGQLQLISKTKTRFYIAAGLNTYKYREEARDANLINGQKTRFTASISAGYDLIVDKEKNNLFVRFELSFIPTGFSGDYAYNNTGQAVAYKRSVSNFFLLGGPSMHVNIYNGIKTKVFAGVGIGYASAYTVVKSNEGNTGPVYAEPTTKRITGDLYIPVTIDAVVKNNYIISLGYTFLDIQDPYTIRSIGLRFGYIFK